jgi:hypothetical protein
VPNHGNKVPIIPKHGVNVKDKIRPHGPNGKHGLLNLGDGVNVRMRMINPPRRKHLPSDADIPGIPHLEVALNDVHEPNLTRPQ